MSVCTFLASDHPLELCSRPDAPFFLLPFRDVEEPIWNREDRRNPERPSFCCLTIKP